MTTVAAAQCADSRRSRQHASAAPAGMQRPSLPMPTVPTVQAMRFEGQEQAMRFAFKGHEHDMQFEGRPSAHRVLLWRDEPPLRSLLANGDQPAG